MRLEAKFNLSTGVLAFFILAGAAFTHLRLVRVQQAALTEDARRTPLMLAMHALRSDVAGMVIATQSSLLAGAASPDQIELERLAVQKHVQIDMDLAALQEAGKSLEHGPDAPDLQRLSRQVEELEGSREAAGDPATSQAALAPSTLLRYNAFSDTSASIYKAQSAVRESELDGLRQSNSDAVRDLWIAALLGVLLGGSLSFVLARRTTAAINLVAHRANAIASGDLTGSPLAIGTQDEIGTMSLAMNEMQAALGGIIGTVAETAGSLTGSTASMRTASEQIHRRIDQQSQQTQQAATAMQEMSASIAEVSRHTQSAAETARSAAQTARDGGLIVKQMLGAMHSIASAVTETSSTVGLLGEDSKRISQIVTVIDEIARKTNLLALNAAIEAARAGDQGRGFAVVAGEVRRLAESTAQATGEIGAMIQEIQDRTRSAIASMAAGTGTVQEGVVTTTQAGEALERIIGMAERVDRMIAQIAIAASQQAAVADQSSASLDSIHSLSHENLSEMATTAAGIESMRGTAVTLERQVDRFQVQQAHGAWRAA